MDALTWFETEVSRVTAHAFARMMRDVSTRLYLYYARGSILVDSQPVWCSPRYQLATCEAIPIHLEQHQLRAWIRDRLRGVACLPDC